MTSLNIDTGYQHHVATSDRFWSRHSKSPVTRGQKVFDVIFGVIAPVLCFIFDPGIFQGRFGGGLLTDYQAFVYMVSGVEILLLLTWLICGRQLQQHTHLLGGLLISGALLSGLIGVVILPFSLIGLIFVIGILGFIPYVTAFVYWRNGYRAFQAAGKSILSRACLNSVMLGCVLVVGVPAGISFTASRLMSASMNTVIYANPRDADMAIEQIRYLQFISNPDLDRLVSAYTAEQRPAHKEELRRRYLKLTGEEIEVRQRLFLD